MGRMRVLDYGGKQWILCLGASSSLSSGIYHIHHRLAIYTIDQSSTQCQTLFAKSIKTQYRFACFKISLIVCETNTIQKLRKGFLNKLQYLLRNPFLNSVWAGVKILFILQI